MLIGQIKAKYLQEGLSRLDKSNRSGSTPSGSRTGTCAAQLQMLAYPAISKPTALPPRSLMNFSEGDRGEQWFAEEIKQAVKGEWGLAQQPFHLPVNVDARTFEIAMEKGRREYGRPGRLWATVIPGFLPAKIAYSGSKYTYRACPPEAKGLVLDPETQTVWVPMKVDGIVQHPTVGLAVAEIKSMSNYAFRAACMGRMGYGYRCQLAAARKATGLATVWFVYRKETFHLGEIAMAQTPDGKVHVVIERLNGEQERFLADLVGEEAESNVTNELGGAATLPGDDLWDVASVVAPYDPRLIEEIEERVRRVIAIAPTGPGFTAWDREYGPDFRCKTCEGTGKQTLAKVTREPLKKGPKACEDCGAMGWLREAFLPRFPCGYCPVVQTCWPMAELRIEGDKPYYAVTKAEVEAAGFTFRRPATY